MAFSKDPKERLNKTLANVGALLSTEVEGRVSTQLDPRASHNTSEKRQRRLTRQKSENVDEMVQQVNELLKMYTSMDIDHDRLIFQIPATWEGICAIERLEQSGICTIVELVFRFSHTMSSLLCSFVDDVCFVWVTVFVKP